AHGSVGDVLMARGNVQEALRNYRAQLPIFEHLVRRDPLNAGWQVDLASSHAQVADVFVAEGELEKALESYRRSHLIREQSLKIDPSNVEGQLDLLWSHGRLALFLDDPAKRIEVIRSTLRKLKEERKLTAEQEGWLPFAEEAHAALNRGTAEFQSVMLSIF